MGDLNAALMFGENDDGALTIEITLEVVEMRGRGGGGGRDEGVTSDGRTMEERVIESLER